MVSPTAIRDASRWTGIAAQALRVRTVIVVYAVLIALYVAFLHPWMMTWGATTAEQHLALPGDEVAPETYYTRAITIDAPTTTVWRWVVQIGQDRAGFYSNTWLENLFGGDIHNSWELRPEWQKLSVGDTVPMAPRGSPMGDATLLKIREVVPGQMVTDLPGRWVLLPLDGQTTRALLREPSAAAQWGDFVAFWVWDPAHFVMEQRMLQGVKERGEGQPIIAPALQIIAWIGWIVAGAAVLGLFLWRRRCWQWLVLPLLAVADGLLVGHDPQAGLAGFLAVGITVAGALVFGRRWWAAFTYVGAFVLLVLLLAPDAFAAFGLLFDLAIVGAVVLRHCVRRLTSAPERRLRLA